MLIVAIIIAVIIYYFFFKSKEKANTAGNTSTAGAASKVADNEVSRLLKGSRFYAENKGLFDYIANMNQPRYKVELLLQSLELGHELEINGNYIFQSIREDLPYFAETEEEHDCFHNDEDPVLLGSLLGIQSLLFGTLQKTERITTREN